MDERELKEIEEKIEELIQVIGLGSDRCYGSCRGDPERGYAPRVPLDEVSEALIREVRPELIGEFHGIPALKGDEKRGCYAFDHEEGECSILEIRPFYCKIYPYRIGAIPTLTQYGGSGYFAGLSTQLQRCGTFDPNKLDREERHRLERKASELIKHYPVLSARLETMFRENPKVFEEHKIR